MNTKLLQKQFLNSDYTINNNCLYKEVKKKNDTFKMKISNFIPYIVKEINFDDGAMNERIIYIKGFHETYGELPLIKIKSSEFNDLSWIHKNWGLKCNIEPEYKAKDYLKYAIQLTASSVKEEKVFGHLGFRKVNDWSVNSKSNNFLRGIYFIF